MEYREKILKVAQTIVAGMESLQRPANLPYGTRRQENVPVVSTTAGATNPYPPAKPAASTAVPEPWRVGTPIPPPSNTPALRESNENTLRSTPNIKSSYTPPSVPAAPATRKQRIQAAVEATRAAKARRATVAPAAKAKGGRRTTVNKHLNKRSSRRSTYRR